MDYQPESKKSIDFRDKYVNYYGNATVKAVDYIAEHIK